MNFRNRK